MKFINSETGNEVEAEMFNGYNEKEIAEKFKEYLEVWYHCFAYANRCDNYQNTRLKIRYKVETGKNYTTVFCQNRGGASLNDWIVIENNVLTVYKQEDFMKKFYKI